MRSFGKFALKLGAIGVAAGAILTLPATAAHADTPSITITPSADVANNGVVSVSGTGFPTTDTSINVLECSGITGVADCDLTTLQTGTLTSGSFSGVMVTVHTGTVGAGACAAGGTCYISAGSSTTPDPTNSTANTFTFAAAATTPTITVTPATGVNSGDSVTVAGSGFPTTDTTMNLVECSAPGAQSHCDLATYTTAPLTAGSFSTTMAVHDGVVGDGVCADGGTCYISGSSVVTGNNATNTGVGSFSFAASALPSATATPHTGIVKNTAIAVTGEHFAPSVSAVVSECSGLGDSAHCDTTPADLVFTSTDGDGNLTATYNAKFGAVGDGQCVAGSTCYIAVTTNLSPTGGDATNTAFAPLTYKALTGPQVTLKPSTNVKDGGSINITGTGFPKKAQSAYVVECGLNGSGQDYCDTNNVGFAMTKADGSIAFTFKGAHTGKLGTKGTCKAGGKCSLSVTTSTSGDPDQTATQDFTFAKGGAVKAAATKTKAKFSKKKDAIAGKVTSAGKGVKGVKTELDIKAGKKWKKVASAKTHKGGAFVYKHIKKNGKYEVKTLKSKALKASHSKKLHVKLA